MTTVEVNVKGKAYPESIVFHQLLELRRAIGGLCGVPFLDVRIAFYQPTKQPGIDGYFRHCDVVIEIMVNSAPGVFIPYADQSRDRILQAVPALNEFTIGVSIPAQNDPYHTARNYRKHEAT
jgi:hypothetical protein